MTRALRVALVGFGPRGLFALERLVHHAARRGARLDVVAYDPHPVRGAGPVYDPTQPPYLRMNLAADRLDLWAGDNAAVPADRRATFTQWRRTRDAPGGTEQEERYPPRSLVGEYLADGLAVLRRHLPHGVTLRVVPREVTVVGRAGGRWSVTAEGDVPARYERVMLTVGHGTTIAAAPAGPWRHAVPLVPAVFPVGGGLPVRAGATVAVRGFALTFLDAALAMTEGRGGVFAEGGDEGMRYVASGDEPAVIAPWSRTGRPMLVKPDPAVAASVPGAAGIVADGAEALAALPPVAGLRDDLLPVLAGTAAALLRAATGGGAGDVVVAEWLAGACGGRLPPGAGDPVAQIRRSLDVGAGRRPPDAPWALGRMWQGLYPALVGRLGGDGLVPGDWPAFLRLAAEMERIAFGPPPVNGWKLVALADAGLVDMSWAGGERLVTDGGATTLRRGGRRLPVDVVVNAVLAAPGAHAPAHPVVAGLVERGLVRVASCRRGLEVDADGTCIGGGGGRSEGLAALGRVTEDSVVGNDTLNRGLHGHMDRWARRVVSAAPVGEPHPVA